MSFEKLYYKGIPVKIDPTIPKGEVWFVTRNFRIIKKFKMDEKINYLQKLLVWLKTCFYELLEVFKKPSKINWLDWKPNDKQK